METAIREYRVWTTQGIIYSAFVYKRKAWFTVEENNDCFHEDDKLVKRGFRSESDAYSFARILMEDARSRALEWYEKEFGEDPGIEDDIFVQVVENGMDIDF